MWASDLWSASERRQFRNVCCYCRDKMSHGEQELIFSQRSSCFPKTRVKLVHACVWCIGKLALLLHLWKCALSKLLSSNVFFSDVLSFTPFKNMWFLRFQGQGDSCCLLACFVQRKYNIWEALVPEKTWPRCHRCVWSMVKIHYIIINDFLPSGKCNMLSIFILNVKS